MIISLTKINSQAIPLRLWLIQNQRLKELEKSQDKPQLIELEKADIRMH